MCRKTTMDKFHVFILMVEVSLDEAIDYFVLDIFSAVRLGILDSINRNKMSLLLGRWQKKGNGLLK